MNDTFKAISNPVRRGIVERLAGGPATVGAATAGLGVSKPAITKHLRVLEESGLVTRVIDGRTHTLSLSVEALNEAGAWIEEQRGRWSLWFEAVDNYLRQNP